MRRRAASVCHSHTHMHASDVESSGNGKQRHTYKKLELKVSFGHRNLHSTFTAAILLQPAVLRREAQVCLIIW